MNPLEQKPPVDQALQYLQNGALEEAFRCLSQIPLSSGGVDVNLAWAFFFIVLGKNGPALDVLDKVLTIDPSNSIALDVLNSAQLTEVLARLKERHCEIPTPKVEIYFDLNDGCNLKCIMCSERRTAKDQTVLSKEVFKERVIPFLKAASDFQMGCQYETLLVPWFEEAVFLMRDAGIVQKGKSISNGMLLSPSKARACIESNVFNLLRFSMDGASPAVFEGIRRGAKLDVFMRNIKTLVDIRNQASSPTKIGLNFTVQRGNVHEIADTVRLAAELGVDAISTHKLHPDDFAPLERDYYDRIKGAMAEAVEVAASVGVEFSPMVYTCKDDEIPSSNECGTLTNSGSRGDSSRWEITNRCGWLQSGIHIRIDSTGDVFVDCSNAVGPFANLYCSTFGEIMRGFLFRHKVMRMMCANEEHCGSCYVLGPNTPDPLVSQN